MIRSLGYLRIESADVAAWREFGIRILGLTEGRGPEDGALYLRMDDFPARLVIVPGSTVSGCSPPAGRWPTRPSWPTSGAGPRRRGRRGQGRHPRRTRRAPGGRTCCASTTPRATPIEVFCGAALEHRPAVSPYGNTFVTGRNGPRARRAAGAGRGRRRARLLHRACSASGCGTRCGCRAEFFGGAPGDPPVWFRFLGCNPRHHSLALAPMPAPAGDRAPDDRGGDAGRRRPGPRTVHAGGESPVSASLGRHANDLMVSFYAAHPGRVRHRVRHRRPAGRRRHMGQQGDHRGQPLGTQLCRPRRA